MSSLVRGVALCAGLLLGGLVYSAENSGDWFDENLAIKGFGTLGLARSDSNAAEYVRDLSQPSGVTRKWTAKTDSLLGVQANLKLGTQTTAVLQLVSRYRYDGSYRPEVSWAFLRHDPTPDIQLRLGRLGTEFYMQADSRLVGYSNTTVRPPPDFYGLLIFSYFDGLDASATLPLGDGLLRGKLYAGRSPETSPFYRDITWDLEGTRLVGGHLDYFLGPWQFRYSHTNVKFSGSELPLNALADSALAGRGLGFLTPSGISTQIPELSTINTTSRFDSLGAIYDDGPLRILAMLGRIHHETQSYEGSRSAFIIGSYRIGSVTPYLGYSVTKSSTSKISTVPPGPFGSALADLAKQLTKVTHTDQHTVTLGTRWDFQSNLALKAQLDVIRGKPESVFFFRGDSPQWDGRMQVFSVALDFAF